MCLQEREKKRERECVAVANHMFGESMLDPPRQQPLTISLAFYFSLFLTHRLFTAPRTTALFGHNTFFIFSKYLKKSHCSDVGVLMMVVARVL